MWKAWSVGMCVVEEGLVFTCMCLAHAAVSIYSSLLSLHRVAPCSVFGGQDEVQVAPVTHACESQVSPELVSLMCDIHSVRAAQSTPQAHNLVFGKK